LLEGRIFCDETYRERPRGDGAPRGGRSEPARLRFIGALAPALTVTMVHATWTCFAAVFQYLQQAQNAPFAKTLMTGLMESTRPATLGGALLTIALILVAVGTYRSSQHELRALRG